MQEVAETKILRGKLTDKETVQQLDTLRNLFSTTVGPYGSIKLLRNNCGGHITLTSSSSRLLAALRPTNPLARLIIEASLKHSHTYGDGALFMVRFILILIEKALKLDLDHRLIIKVNSFLLELFISYLRSDKFPCKMAVEISDVNSFCQVASTMLSSKPLCQFDEQLLKLMSSVLLETFIMSLPSERLDSSLGPIWNNIHIIGISGEETHNSFCCKGLLLEPANIKEVLSWKTKTESLGSSLLENICTVVINVSMAGDSIELPQLTYTNTSLKELEQSFLSHMELFCSELISEGVRVLFCQKVVHPCLKDQLRRNGVLVLDRLGALLCSKVINLTGSVPISSFSSACSPVQLGNISKLSVMDVFGKQWLHLNQISSSLTTLVVCSHMEEQLEELKVNCNNVMLAFQQLLNAPSILYGGGCWQFTLANKLRVEVSENLERLSNELDCSESQLLQLCDNLCASLEQAASPPPFLESKKCFTHPSAGHLWILDDPEVNTENTRCSCGLLCCSLSDLKLQPLERSPPFDRSPMKGLHGSYKPVDIMTNSDSKKSLLMDCFTPWKTALEVSVLIANMAIGTNQYIYDTNYKLLR